MQAAEFDLHAQLEDSHWWFRARRDIVFALLQQRLPPSRARRLLEIGCGTGGNLRLLSQHYSALGVEIDPYAAGLAARRAGCDVRCGELDAALQGMDFAPDAVLLLDVLEHVEDDRALLAQALARLPTGGLLLLTVPADPRLWSPHDVALGHYRRYTQASLSAVWQGLPVEVLRLSGFNALLYPLIRLARLLRRDAGSDLAPAPRWLNGLLYRIFVFERRLLAHRNLSWGCSLVAILRKSAT